jgi:hypothetical protein
MRRPYLCLFCSSCHNNEMSRLGYIETIPIATPGMAWLRLCDLCVSVVTIHEKQNKTWAGWGIWDTTRRGAYCVEQSRYGRKKGAGNRWHASGGARIAPNKPNPYGRIVSNKAKLGLDG